MTKSILLACACFLAHPALASGTAVVLESDMKTIEYTASIGGPYGCMLPADLTKINSGECLVTKGKLETGWKIVKEGGRCYRDNTELVAMNSFPFGHLDVEAPNTIVRRENISCPSEPQ